MGKEKVETLLLTYLGLFGKGQYTDPQEAQAWTKNIDCVLLGYAFNSIGYRFLIVKSEVSDMHVGTIMESNDATFFEYIFPMKDMPTSSNQEIPTLSGQDLIEIPETTISIEHVENPKEDDNEAPVRSKRQRTLKSFGDDFLVYLMDDTLSTISEAYASLDADCWKEVSRCEMDFILANGT